MSNVLVEASELLVKHNGDCDAVLRELLAERQQYVYKSKAKRVLEIREIEDIICKKQREIREENYHKAQIAERRKNRSFKVIDKRIPVLDMDDLENIYWTIVDRFEELRQIKVMELYEQGKYREMNEMMRRELKE